MDPIIVHFSEPEMCFANSSKKESGKSSVKEFWKEFSIEPSRGDGIEDARGELWRAEGSHVSVSLYRLV